MSKTFDSPKTREKQGCQGPLIDHIFRDGLKFELQGDRKWNWENDKSYSDVNSLVLLSEVFEISLDQLIKGDVEMMKEQIDQTDQKKFERLSNIFTILFLAVLITPVPLVHFLSYAGLAIWIVILGAGSYAAMLVEREKKKFDMQTYREIIAFTEGKSLSEIEKAREEGKRPYQKVLLAVASGAAGVIVTMFFLWLLG